MSWARERISSDRDERYNTGKVEKGRRRIHDRMKVMSGVIQYISEGNFCGSESWLWESGIYGLEGIRSDQITKCKCPKYGRTFLLVEKRR